ncbi:hypothetical protein ACFOQM_01455 [Paenibacillus sp. GCM10012307]|uniref:Uncharacterized protein n=1 Tax=Paenibacillus roseus TaxID=2798579 RepID=A0A934J1R8_9BACL|nr:hypothetical protein [Paenibacillus roseus]MBJ6359989.1 hypothetical protein [Paenibacillus roseus]
MKKILDVNYPIITSYMTHAPVLAVISQDDKSINWVLSNYLQLSVTSGGGVDFFTPEPPLSCPFLNLQVINRDFLANYSTDPIELIMNAINQDYYLLLLLETSHLSAFQTVGSRPHPVFVHGYCQGSKTVHLADFIRGDNFSLTTASFDELRASWAYFDEQSYWLKGNRLFKLQPNVQYELFYERIIGQISDYAHSRNTLFHLHTLNPELSFGLEPISACLQHSIHCFGAGEPFDRVVFPLVCDHKKLLMTAIRYMEQAGHLEKNRQFSLEYEKLQQRLLALRHVTFKSIISNKRDRASEIQEQVRQWFEDEKKLLLQVLH